MDAFEYPDASNAPVAWQEQAARPHLTPKQAHRTLA